MVPEPTGAGGLYLDACATTPPAAEVLELMARVQAAAWANPASLHGYGLVAAEQLERDRLRISSSLGCQPTELVFTSGGTEAIHTALLGVAACLPPGRLLISAVEHPASEAAARQLEQRGWQLERLPVDRQGLLDLQSLDRLLAPPTRLVSLIWGQSEVGTIQPIAEIGARCRRAGVLLHVDAVQVVGQLPLAFETLPVDLLSCAAHKLQGPRGIGALLVRQGVPFAPLLGGGGQEGGRRGGTEAVALVAGFAQALALAEGRRQAGADPLPVEELRNALLHALLALPQVRLSGPDPRDSTAAARLPHHISLLVADSAGRPISGRRLVRALWQQGVAASSGSACSSGRAAGKAEGSPSPILLAMGYSEAEAASGVRLSLGPWLSCTDLEGVPAALERARQQLLANEPSRETP